MLSVSILDPRERSEREGLIEALIPHARRVDVLLTLDDGSPAEACVEPDDVVWLGLRAGDIVGVAPLAVAAECDAPAVLLSV
jgi:hypothetical protein